MGFKNRSFFIGGFKKMFKKRIVDPIQLNILLTSLKEKTYLRHKMLNLKNITQTNKI